MWLCPTDHNCSQLCMQDKLPQVIEGALLCVQTARTMMLSHKACPRYRRLSDGCHVCIECKSPGSPRLLLFLPPPLHQIYQSSSVFCQGGACLSHCLAGTGTSSSGCPPSSSSSYHPFCQEDGRRSLAHPFLPLLGWTLFESELSSHYWSSGRKW